jgi:hypothetical protein
MLHGALRQTFQPAEEAIADGALHIALSPPVMDDLAGRPETSASSKHLFNDFPIHIRQPVVAAIVREGQAFVVESK